MEIDSGKIANQLSADSLEISKLSYSINHYRQQVRKLAADTTRLSRAVVIVDAIRSVEKIFRKKAEQKGDSLQEFLAATTDSLVQLQGTYRDVLQTGEESFCFWNGFLDKKPRFMK